MNTFVICYKLPYMDYNILKKSIKFKDRNFPVEIFCKEEYKDYYIRGQVIELSSKDYFFLTRGAFTSYYFILFVLARKKTNAQTSFDHMLSSEICNSNFCNFFYRSPEDFIYLQKIWESDSKNNIIKNPPISIKLKDVPIIEDPYFKESIQYNKDIIILDLSVHLNSWVSWQKHPEIQQEFKDSYDDYMSSSSVRIHSLCGYHLVNEEKSSENSVYNWFYNLYEKIYSISGNGYLGRRDFFRILSNYGHLSRGKIFSSSKPIDIKKYIGKLNIYNTTNIYFKKKENDICPLTRFCNSFFYDLINDLKTSKIIGQCQLCGDYFNYRRNKKYCNKEDEGKNCNRKTRSARYYKKDPDKFKLKSKEYIQAYRKDIKEWTGKVFIRKKE